MYIFCYMYTYVYMCYMYEPEPVNFIMKLNHGLTPVLFSLTIRMDVLHYHMRVSLVSMKLLLN